jgi:peptidyl-prolyl cis-trans isomerase C
MAVHFHPPPSREAPAAPRGPALPEHDITVNGFVIAAPEVAAEMQHHPAADAEAAWRAAARALVIRRLLLDAATAAGIAPDDEEEAVTALLAREIRPPEPDEAACRRWHAAHPERFGSPEWWEASHVLIAADPEDEAARAAAEAKAAALIEELRAVPGALPDLARRHSDCPSREAGGHLGRVERGSTVPEFEAALAALAPGETAAAPVASRYGLHIVQLHRHGAARAEPFETALAAVRRDLARAAWHAATRQFIARLAAAARIEGFAFGEEGEARADGPLVN